MMIVIRLRSACGKPVENLEPLSMPSLLSLLVFLGWIGLWLPVALGITWLVKIPWKYPIAPQHKLPLLLPLYLLAPVALGLYHRYGQGETWASYGLAWQPHTLPTLILGLGIAMVGVALLVAVQLSLGWRQWRPSGPLLSGSPASTDAAPLPLLMGPCRYSHSLLAGWRS